jgi:hypothetical protein
MRWRQAFMFEVWEALYQLGMKACPVCHSTDALGVSPVPALIIDAELPPGPDGLPLGEEPGGDLTFAVRVECATCGHIMLFNAQKFRTADEKILEPGAGEEREGQPGDYA